MNDALVSNIEKEMKREGRSSENVKLESPSSLPMTPEVVAELAKKRICVQWVPREIGFLKQCAFDGSECKIQMFEKHSDRWRFTYCPLKIEK